MIKLIANDEKEEFLKTSIKKIGHKNMLLSLSLPSPSLLAAHLLAGEKENHQRTQAINP